MKEIPSILKEDETEDCPHCGHPSNRITGDNYGFWHCYNSDCKVQLFSN